ncbi:hypothetical protein FB451DRAFT_1393659 [Mycena latifolia]|nr:hypothetical protein FB451DRAFT_1393659 [Mycena latifolia]
MFDSAELEGSQNAFTTFHHPSSGGRTFPTTVLVPPRHDPTSHHIRPRQEPTTNITGGTFIGGNVNQTQRHGEAGLHILHRVSAGDAFHDSAERFPQPQCHPETRKDILDELWNWASETDPSSKPGVGRSPWGSFFFKRGHSSRGNGNRLFATIAYQLALPKQETHSDLNRLISRRAKKNPSILDRSLSAQLQELIFEPCRWSSSGGILVIVIDGLDECDGQHIQQEIIRAIGKRVYRQTGIFLRFLIASRPEPHIGEIFRSPSLAAVHRPFNIRKSFEDVRSYLLDEFTRIHTEHLETMACVPTPWPSRDVVRKLVQKSSGYFIYASTVIKFVDDKNFRPTDRLEMIMGLAEPEFGSPFAALDQLYNEILSSVPRRPQLLQILTSIAAGFSLRSDHCGQLLAMTPGDVRLTLRGLRSLLTVPEESDPVDYGVLTAHHASFRDFLVDHSRSGPLYVGGAEHQTDLARCILKAFSYTFNDPSVHRHGYVAWELGETAFQHIASVAPSPDLAYLLQSFNPDFLFASSELRLIRQSVGLILHWLEKIHPLPGDLIQRWQDYRFMAFCDYYWSHPICDYYWSHPICSRSHQRPEVAASIASPELIRVLHAYSDGITLYSTFAFC